MGVSTYIFLMSASNVANRGENVIHIIKQNTGSENTKRTHSWIRIPCEVTGFKKLLLSLESLSIKVRQFENNKEVLYIHRQHLKNIMHEDRCLRETKYIEISDHLMTVFLENKRRILKESLMVMLANGSIVYHYDLSSNELRGHEISLLYQTRMSDTLWTAKKKDC